MKQEHQHDFDQVIGHLRAKGVRITETRKAVIDYIIQSHDHPSAEMIYQDLKPNFPNMSLATVYNNLKVLIDEGFVAELKVRNDTTTYFDFMGHQHLNVICEKCGRIADMELELPDVMRLKCRLATTSPKARRLSMAYAPNASKRRCDCKDD